MQTPSSIAPLIFRLVLSNSDCHANPELLTPPLKQILKRTPNCEKSAARKHRHDLKDTRTLIQDSRTIRKQLFSNASRHGKQCNCSGGQTIARSHSPGKRLRAITPGKLLRAITTQGNDCVQLLPRETTACNYSHGVHAGNYRVQSLPKMKIFPCYLLCPANYCVQSLPPSAPWELLRAIAPQGNDCVQSLPRETIACNRSRQKLFKLTDTTHDTILYQTTDWDERDICTNCASGR